MIVEKITDGKQEFCYYKCTAKNTDTLEYHSPNRTGKYEIQQVNYGALEFIDQSLNIMLIYYSTMQCNSLNKIIQVCKNAVETDLCKFVKSNKIYTTR